MHHSITALSPLSDSTPASVQSHDRSDTNHIIRPTSLAALQTEIAAFLQLPVTHLQIEDNLLHAGLDSIRLMILIERWQLGSINLTFVDLAEKPTLSAWWTLLAPWQNN